MNTAEKSRLVCVLHALNSAFGKALDEQKFVDQLRAWEIALEGLDIGDIERASQKWLREHEFAPTPAGIRKIAEGSSVDARALLAWADTLEAIRRPSLRAEVEKDRLKRKVLDNLGGWEILGTTESQALLSFTRQRFIEVYKALDGGAWITKEIHAIEAPKQKQIR